MKKNNQMFILILLNVLFSCTNIKKEAPKEEAKLNTEVINITKAPTMGNLDHNTSKEKKYDDVLSSMNYSFSNDTLCQSINIKEINKNEKLGMPEKLKFTLILHDKQNKYDDKILEGVAKLSSSEESFSDNSEKDGGDYFAADYNFETAEYKIQIRLDIQNYEACVVLVNTSRPDIILGGYSAYLKKFPNEGVMKKGNCK